MLVRVRTFVSLFCSEMWVIANLTKGRLGGVKTYAVLYESVASDPSAAQKGWFLAGHPM